MFLYKHDVVCTTLYLTKTKTAGHLVFWKDWPAVDLKKAPRVTNMVSSSEPIDIYKAFLDQDRLTLLNRHMIV